MKLKAKASLFWGLDSLRLCVSAGSYWWKQQPIVLHMEFMQVLIGMYQPVNVHALDRAGEEVKSPIPMSVWGYENGVHSLNIQTGSQKKLFQEDTGCLYGLNKIFLYWHVAFRKNLNGYMSQKDQATFIPLHLRSCVYQEQLPYLTKAILF